MEYLITLIEGAAVIFFVFGIIWPKKMKQALYHLFYLLPFWSQGLLALFFSIVIWRTDKRWAIFILSFLIGASMLLFPKRRIKKSLEALLSVSDRKILLISTGLALLLLLEHLFR